MWILGIMQHHVIRFQQNSLGDFLLSWLSFCWKVTGSEDEDVHTVYTGVIKKPGTYTVQHPPPPSLSISPPLSVILSTQPVEADRFGPVPLRGSCLLLVCSSHCRQVLAHGRKCWVSLNTKWIKECRLDLLNLESVIRWLLLWIGAIQIKMDWYIVQHRYMLRKPEFALAMVSNHGRLDMVEAVQCHNISLVLCCADGTVCVLFLLAVLVFQFQVLWQLFHFKTDVSINSNI